MEPTHAWVYSRAITGDADITVSENRRLQKEVRQLRERVAALEASRWWRLHPRFLLRRLDVRAPHPQRGPKPAQSAPAQDAAPVVVHPVAARFREDVVSSGDFTRDWFTRNIPIWEPILRQLEGRGARILELGSFEGLSACFLLWRLPDAHLTCVDNFLGPPEYAAYGTLVPERRFDANVALVDDTRVRKLVGDTGRVLFDLVTEAQEFDFVYVDAGHRALEVMVDACLAWQLLAPGGVMIFDDYDWVSFGDDPLLRPAPAIDAFASLVATHSELIVEHPRQIAVRKAPLPEQRVISVAESEAAAGS
jgi:predicted O-methyltransferase YrrM